MKVVNLVTQNYPFAEQRKSIWQDAVQVFGSRSEPSVKQIMRHLRYILAEKNSDALPKKCSNLSEG